MKGSVIPLFTKTSPAAEGRSCSRCRRHCALIAELFLLRRRVALLQLQRPLDAGENVLLVRQRNLLRVLALARSVLVPHVYAVAQLGTEHAPLAEILRPRDREIPRRWCSGGVQRKQAVDLRAIEPSPEDRITTGVKYSSPRSQAAAVSTMAQNPCLVYDSEVLPQSIASQSARYCCGSPF